MSRPDIDLIETVAEACADALLTACAAVITVRDDVDEPGIAEVIEQALGMFDRIIERTMREGAKPT